MRQHRTDKRRRGAVTVYVTIVLVVVLGMAVLAIDAGMLYVARGELQRAADASALAGSWKMISDDRLKGSAEQDALFAVARAEAASFGYDNPALYVNLAMDHNIGNASGGDIVMGTLGPPWDRGQAMDLSDPDTFNSMQVRTRRDQDRNGSIVLFFARIFGYQNSDGWAQATATFRDDVVGFRINEHSGNVGLLPMALHIDRWNELLAGTRTTGDSYAYNPSNGQVTGGGDGIIELNLYPGAGPTQLPPGNFGTVDIGNPNNATADIERQILHGVNESDLAWFGGEINISANGYIMMNGDTGLSAAVKDELEAVKGQPRSIPLFDQVSGPGNNCDFRVVGFAGIRVMHVKLTGAMSQKAVIIQPAMVSDGTALTGGNNRSRFVVAPPRLTR
jgi:hypothetical protein